MEISLLVMWNLWYAAWWQWCLPSLWPAIRTFHYLCGLESCSLGQLFVDAVPAPDAASIAAAKAQQRVDAASWLQRLLGIVVGRNGANSIQFVVHVFYDGLFSPVLSCWLCT